MILDAKRRSTNANVKEQDYEHQLKQLNEEIAMKYNIIQLVKIINFICSHNNV